MKPNKHITIDQVRYSPPTCKLGGIADGTPFVLYDTPYGEDAVYLRIRRGVDGYVRLNDGAFFDVAADHRDIECLIVDIMIDVRPCERSHT